MEDRVDLSMGLKGTQGKKTKLKMEIQGIPPIYGAGGSSIYVDNVKQNRVDFTSQPQEQITNNATAIENNKTAIESNTTAITAQKDHNNLINRDKPNQHTMGAITGLETALNGKQASGDYLLSTDISDWAKQPTKPTYTATEVGAETQGTATTKVSEHNVDMASHNDIRLLISTLQSKVNAFLDSDDTTLDQLSELIVYIKENRADIESITSGKVNVTDIINNLTTNVANKPLSSAMGVELKRLIDAIVVPTALADLTDDTTHRLVTDTEKTTWNNAVANIPYEEWSFTLDDGSVVTKKVLVKND